MHLEGWALATFVRSRDLDVKALRASAWVDHDGYLGDGEIALVWIRYS
jgi:hypothetical protein